MMVDNKSFKRLEGQFKDSLISGEWKLIRISDNLLMGKEQFRKGKFKGGTALTEFNYYGEIPFDMIYPCPDDNEKKLNNTESFSVDTTVFSKSLVYSDVEQIFKVATGKNYKIKNRRAMYPEGDYSLFEFIANHLVYPITAQQNKIYGKVYVGVVVDSLGNTKDVKILKGIQPDLDNEALRVMRLIKKWFPAIQEGKAIEATISIPIKFEIK
jgi:TonB family protein